MLIYIVILIFSFLFGLFELFFKKPKDTPRLNLAVFFVSCLGLTILSATRECGGDYESYYDIFRNINWSNWHNSLETTVEPAYGFVNAMSANYHMMLFLMSVISLIPFYRFILKVSPFPLLTLFLFISSFYYAFYSGVIRQAMALTFVVNGYLCLPNKRKFIALVLIGALFHLSAVVALVMIFIPEKIKPSGYYLICFGIAVASNLLMSAIVFGFIDSFPPFVATKLKFYIATESEEGQSFGFNFAWANRFVLFWIFYYFRDKIKNIKYGELFFTLYFIYLMMYMGFGFLPQVAGRGSAYFLVSEMVLLPMALYVMNNTQRIVFGLPYILLFAVRQYTFFINEPWHSFFVPYKSWLFFLT